MIKQASTTPVNAPARTARTGRAPGRCPRPSGSSTPSMARACAQAGQLAMDAPVAAARIVPGHLQHQRPHGRRSPGATGTAARVSPVPPDKVSSAHSDRKRSLRMSAVSASGSLEGSKSVGPLPVDEPARSDSATTCGCRKRLTRKLCHLLRPGNIDELGRRAVAAQHGRPVLALGCPRLPSWGAPVGAE